MGDFEQGNSVESTNHDPKSRLKAMILLILGLFAPVIMMVNTWGMFPEVNIQSMFWMFNQSPYMPSFFGFSLIPFYAMTSMFPFLLLRMATVSQIYRYYNGKTTRKRALIAACIGDGIFLIVALPSLIISFMFGNFNYFMIPLPFQMIVGLMILWRSPLPIPTTPWESVSEPKSWWEKEPKPPEEKKEKPTKDDDDVLW